MSLNVVPPGKDLMAALSTLLSGAEGWISATGIVEEVQLRVAGAEGARPLAGRFTLASLGGPAGGPYGVVLSRVREAGAIVNAGETVFVLSLTNPVWVRTYVSEPDLARVKPGMPVEVRTDARDAKPLKGVIGFISTTAEFTPKTVETRELRTALVYRIRIVVEDPDGVLRQGMPVSVGLPDATDTGNAK